ncbi:RnfH family protein [Candidatus Ishikawella capsulata]|uniref:UPF0125 protein ICMP_458 n=1 Tax=Candidatus Ishikawaella capsulata Mpkobe TaxID=476281 RepID=C5WDA4_9ENTR|nr:RnfH family protein [Candidatus Ishikawaella capsulata]BAH83310.1 hypothetical protein ICMP_458 [Candidatus Ishikawaella capsulata Mpkobe]
MCDILVEVVYALSEKQYISKVKLTKGSIVKDAIQASGILNVHPEINFYTNKFGIYGKLVELNKILSDKDRVEIYRPIISHPRELRYRNYK